MKYFYIFCFILAFISCKNDSDALIVNGTIKGLKKGTVYLKKANDSLVVTLDSVQISGQESFTLKSKIDAPEVFFLDLNKQSKDNERITFFGDKGTTQIETTLKYFSYDAKIKGSKQHELLESYLAMISKFNNKNLDLIKDNFNAKMGQDSAKINTTQKQLNSLEKNKYLYTVNFALTNSDSEVAPYIALTEAYNANIKLLDTINNSLTPRIKSSKYGVKFQKFIDKIKAEDNL